MSMFNPPKPPDPNQALNLGNQEASAQQGFNEAAQQGSMVNQNNQYGSLNYQQTGTGANGVPIYTANTTLSPQQQQLFDTLMGTKGTAGQQASTLLSGANYGGQNPSDVIGGMTSGTTQDLLSKETGYLQPFFTTQTDQLDTKLRNQGLFPGQPGYDVAMRNLTNTQGGTVSNFLATAEPAAYTQAKSTYEEPLNLATTEAGIGAPTDPNGSFVNSPALQPANLTGATANMGQMLDTQYNAQNQQYGNLMSGLFGIPTSVLGSMAKSGGGLSGLTSLFGGGAGLTGFGGAGAGLDAAAALLI